MYFPLDKLLDYEGNRFELARACIEYAKKVRSLKIEEYVQSGEKDALVALRAVLNGEIKFVNAGLLSEEIEDDILDFVNAPEDQI